MATTIRTPPDLLKPVHDMVASPRGPLLMSALQAALDQRKAMAHRPPAAWTVPEAIEVLDPAVQDIELFAALRLLQGASPDRARLGYSLVADEDPVRIDQELRNDFAPYEVTAVAESRGTATSGRPTVLQSALGLTGPNGALPYTWTEFANDMARSQFRAQRDTSLMAFFNVLQRRHLAFVYRAWQDSQAVAGADRPAEPHPLADRLRALAGLALGDSAQRDSVPAAFKSAFASAFSRRVHTPQALAAMLSRFFEAEVCVEEFVAHWLPIPDAQRSQLGMHFTVLGVDAVAGSQVWDCSTRFRIRIKALRLERYYSFLPHGEAYAQLADLVALYAGVDFDWELVPELLAEEVPHSTLDSAAPLLGWSSWLGVRTDTSDAEDLRLTMSPNLRHRTCHPMGRRAHSMHSGS
ncbi:MAG: type VI secretion system baseplate subunit TssG [Burkholderiales bacterium]|nr:type VI secretion system baseplate subunit TssG [Burkholderiales bacterium]